MQEANTNLVYVVDDEPNIRKLTTLALKEYGFETQEFSNGDDLLKAVKRRIPDVIILDWVMPAPDGLSICGRLKLDKDTRTVPIILLTARDDEVDCVLGLEMGADDYVTKPFSLKERTRVPISVDDGSYDQKKLRKSNTLSRFDLPEAL